MKHTKLQSSLWPEKVEAGVDEAGRGCLAGPVVAAAVILPKDFHHPFLNDSKQLSRKRRDELRIIIESESIAWAIGKASVDEIDKINILQASFLAMHRAIAGLKPFPEFLLIDGNRFKKYPDIEHSSIIGGDGKFLSIAAASVLAKTHRDEEMEILHQNFPNYGWDKNMGYGTVVHRNSLIKFGHCIHHRKSFTLLNKQLALFN
jgi:ribonuclease HII